MPGRAAGRILWQRRAAVAALNGATVLALLAAMVVLLAGGGWSVAEAGMLAAYGVTLPWLSIGFWNAVIGTALAVRGPRADDPLALVAAPEAPITTRTAIVMALRNEDPDASFARLRAMADDLTRHGLAAHFDLFVLSDTDRPEIAAREERLAAAWPGLGYRRRADNAGYKAGNLQEFCARAGDAYDFFLPLDADSLMSAGAVARLVRIMQRHPRIGILQSLVVGLPARAFFTRVFQFGMRHGMRAYTAGAAWWSGDCGPYWGHNALIRMRPFRDHCRLPRLAGGGPLGGWIMSHDQVEAVLMRRAGYHVRVLAEDGGSWEENPPSLPDFIRRELRWCQGNMQYFALLGMPGLKPVSRVQLALAILMYLASPAWMVFVGFSLTALVTGSGGVSVTLGAALFAVILFLSMAPKAMGLAGVLASRRESARYGGRRRVLAGGLVEFALSVLMAPVVGFAIAVFAVGLLFGVRIDWRAQPRGDRRVGWGEAVRSFLPQSLFALVLVAGIGWSAPAMLAWAAPLIAGLALAIPLAVLTAAPAAGRWSVARGLCDVPEDRAGAPLGRLATTAGEAARTAQAQDAARRAAESEAEPRLAA